MKCGSIPLFFALILSFPFFGIVPTAQGKTIAEEYEFLIDQIEISGNELFSASEIEKVLEFREGDRIERRKVVESSKNVQELYRLKGYDDAGVEIQLTRRPIPKTKAFDHVLNVKIREGLPTRVLSMEYIWPKGKKLDDLKRLERRHQIATGEVFDEEKLERLFKALQDDLGARDYMGAKVELKEAYTGSPPTDLNPLPAASKWVTLKVAVDVGERVTFGFRGNKVLSYQDLSLVIDEQRLVGLSQDYVDRIRNQIEEEYRKLGYDQVKIETYTFESPLNQKKHVTFDVNEGSRVKISSVQFDGQIAFNQALLSSLFWQGTTGLTAKGYYVEKEVTKFAELLIEKIKSDGFLSSKLVSATKIEAPEPNQVKVLINIYEGEQTRLDAIEFRGLSVFTPEEVKTFLGVKEEEPLNLYRLNEGIETLKAAYRSKGYYEAVISNEGTPKVVTYFQENRRAHILLDFQEGEQSIVAKVQVEGYQKTMLKVIEREILLKEGEVLEEGRWLESEARIRRLGLFSSVSIQAIPEPDDISRKVLRVRVEEGTPGVIAGGIGIRNDLGARAFGQLSYANLWGKNHTLSFTANANRRFKNFGSTFCASEKQKSDNPNTDHCFIELDSQLAYTFPYAFWGPTSFRPALSVERKQLQFLRGDDKTLYTTFDVDTIALTLTLERTLLVRPNLKGVLAYSVENTRQYNSDFEVDNQRLRIGAFIPTLILDRRDSALSPTKGTYTTLSAEYAAPEFLSQYTPIPIRYTRLQFRNDILFPLPKDVGIFLSYRMGLAYNLSKPPADEPDDQRYGIPLVKQFSLGGVGSMRGFREQSLTVPNNVALLGYTSFVNYRAQIDLPFSGNLRFGPFWDAGAVRYDSFSFGDLRHGVGGGVHYRSPVGPVNFDVGFNPFPKKGEDSYRMHFSIGMI
jgi:outer membrane protein insertion porin family